jgi:unspecific monooxygenase
MLMPAFHAKQIQTYSQLICERTRQVANRWGVGQPFEVRAAMIEIAADVIMHLVFGSYEGERYQKIKLHLAATLDVTNSSPYLLLFKFMQKDLGAWSPWGRFQRQRNKVYEFFQAEINDHRTQPEIADNTLLSVVMSARDEKGQALTDAELKDLLMNALFGGYDTTAIALTWALYWIHKMPQVREKLLDEIDSLGSDPDPMAITRLPYLNAVCSETLRIHPSIFYAFPRVPKSPVQIMGYQFDAGTRLVPSIYLLHRREDLYPESSQFQPDRFIDRQFSPYEYMPFGGGNRGCIGVALAMFQMKLVLATILSDYQLALADTEPVKPKRIGLIIAPSDVRMVLQGRRRHL